MKTSWSGKYVIPIRYAYSVHFSSLRSNAIFVISFTGSEHILWDEFGDAYLLPCQAMLLEIPPDRRGMELESISIF